MQYWLVKTEPGTYSWENMLKDRRTYWDGVRNFQARNNLRAMRLRDLVLFYHSVSERRIMGVVRVAAKPETLGKAGAHDVRHLGSGVQGKEFQLTVPFRDAAAAFNGCHALPRRPVGTCDD